MKVSVLTRTYNQERFISQTIESALMQKTNFQYEIVVADDFSTDGTRSIVQDYADRYPEKIRPLLNPHNLGGVENFVNAYHNCTGEFVALLEGDDYWTSPLKLTKQLMFLDEHTECSMCTHASTEVYEDDDRESISYISPDQKEISTLEDLLLNDFVYTSAAMLRREVFSEFPAWVYESDIEDFPLWVIAAQRGMIGYIREVLGCYRVHKDGIWSRLDAARQVEKSIWVYENVNAELGFEYGSVLQRTLARFRNQLICERAKVPSDAAVMVVSGGDPELLKLYRPAWHFPQAPDGGPGEPLGDSSEAIAQLEELRAKGGRFLLVPSMSFAWFAHYPAFAEHLEVQHTKAWSDEHGVLFDLS
jgi:glycosyltransferase involved in cell wall biosynthesis